MGCNCKNFSAILGLIIVIFSFVEFYSKWIIVVAAALIIVHAMKCSNMSCGMPEGKKKKK